MARNGQEHIPDLQQIAFYLSFDLCQKSTRVMTHAIVAFMIYPENLRFPSLLSQCSAVTHMMICATQVPIIID